MAIEIKQRRGLLRREHLRNATRKVVGVAGFARKHGRVFRLSLAGLTLTLGLVLVATVLYFYSHYSRIVDERLASGYLTSQPGIYAAPRVLRAGQHISRERLIEILRRAGYVDGSASRVWSGRFVAIDDAIEIYPRQGEAPADSSPFEVVKVHFGSSGRIDQLTGDGVRLGAYALAPEALTNDAGVKTDKHQTLSYSDIPPIMVRAILSIEDRRFFEHGGLDPVGIVRAALSWSDSEQDLKQGGSTITQQLVKNTYLTHERTLKRKFHEAILASVFERRMSKEDILALYCNEIYLGQRGSIGVRGIHQAARVFFGKELKDLSLAETATIAGMIQSPGRYAPDRRPEAAKVRRNTVLAAMLRDEWISREEASAASREPVSVAAAPDSGAIAPHFIDYVDRVTSDASIDWRSGSRRVYTTIDVDLQQLAEAAVQRQLEHLGKVFKGRQQPQAALVALDPRTGQVLAMVGGGSYAASQLNRATDARRQPGSVFKPLVYAAAIEGGISPVSMALDAPRVFTYDYRAKYRPANYGGGYSMGGVTLRTALVRSLNVVTVETAMRAGLARVASLAGQLGLPEPAPLPALALGSGEATPLEVAGAYAAFANAGRAVRPTAVVSVDDGSPPPVFGAPVAEGKQVIKPSTAYMLTDMMMDVINRGTGRAARGAVKGTAIAGKTGTSRDGWFAGYTQNLVCVVWVGFDDGSELGLTGAESALPIWTEFVAKSVELRPELGGGRFTRPASITFVEIDPQTGALAAPDCPHRERVAITPGLAPSTECFTHGIFPDALAAEAMVAEEIEGYPVPTTRDLPARVAYTAKNSIQDTSRAYSSSRTQIIRSTHVVISRTRRPVLTNDVLLPTLQLTP